MVQAMEKLSKTEAVPRGGSLTITDVSSQPDNEVRKFIVRWSTVRLGKVLAFFVRLNVTYDNGSAATSSEIVGPNRRSVELLVSEIQGHFRVVSFSVGVTAVTIDFNPPRIEQVTVRQDGVVRP